ncbi:hypothetical protein IHO40_05215 [Wolbachia endosymbiont of Mansonella ozzardi]|uniref:hypothetical protein n=1 Tax=Wolbachia endosymbiont of Mansonella ozzardi TaxID=137464 RepID=UPI001CE087B9|nr:hypothetical protein [Wolbachia endosymbiont of Mansonella ozzardi]MCA4775449.1 hypothetical protein [Wolbachia endosymbiont of Mansonella ozzardi]
MHPNTPGIEFNFKPIDNAVGFPALAYVAAVKATIHGVSFIANILNSRAMLVYALAFIILGTILLTSLNYKAYT